MDLAAVKAAPARQLACGAVAAARNALGLVEDAEVLSGAGRPPRAYSLAVLAVEELGKAASLAVLAALPDNVRPRAPVGRLLEWHQLKLVSGIVFTEVQGAPPAGCPRLNAMTLSELAAILDNAQASADHVDRGRLRGLYVDVAPSGRLQQPSEVTAAQVRDQLDQARLAASAASTLLDPGAPGQIAHPEAEMIDFSRAMISAFGTIGHARSPEAAANLWLDAASKFRG